MNNSHLTKSLKKDFVGLSKVDIHFNFLLKGAMSGLRQFLAIESPLKMMKNAFKALFFSRYLDFCLDFLVLQQNYLIMKIRLIPNFMTSQPG